MAIQLYKRLDVDFEDKRKRLEVSDQDDLSARLSRCTNNLCKGCVAGVYITTNESKADESISQLMQKPRIAHACHIGFSGWHNFDIMAARHSEYGLICDFNPNNKKFIEATLLGLKKTKSREEFIEVIGFGCDKIFQGGIDFFSPNMSSELDGEDKILLPSEEISRDATKERSWLFSDESFNYIKELAVHGRITREIA